MLEGRAGCLLEGKGQHQGLGNPVQWDFLEQRQRGHLVRREKIDRERVLASCWVQGEKKDNLWKQTNLNYQSSICNPRKDLTLICDVE